MAKVSYVISKNSTGNGKSNFHFDGGTGNGKWFSKIFKNGKEEHSSEPNEVVDLISKLVIDGTIPSIKIPRLELSLRDLQRKSRSLLPGQLTRLKLNPDPLKQLQNL